MQNINNNCLGFKLSVPVPSTVEEYDQLAGKKDSALESAIFNVLYRSWNNVFREEFSAHLESATGVKRVTELVFNKDGSPKIDEETKEQVTRYSQSAADHVDAVFSSLVKENKAASVDAAIAAYSSDAQKIADAIKFNPAEKERAPSAPKKTAKKWLDLAAELEKHGPTVFAQVAEKLAAKLGLPVEPTVESVARAIAEDQRRIAAAAAEAAKAAYTV